MQNLSKSELNQIAEIRGQSRDEIERIAKIRRIKNYEGMSKEELIISFLKAKQSIAELFNDNLDDNEISDMRRIFNRLRDIKTTQKMYEIKKKFYEIKNKKNLSEEEKEENDDLRKLVRNLIIKKNIVPMTVMILITMK